MITGLRSTFRLWRGKTFESLVDVGHELQHVSIPCMNLKCKYSSFIEGLLHEVHHLHQKGRKISGHKII